MSFLAISKNLQQDRVFKLINKILLFKYSKENFFAHRRDVTLTLAHDTQLIMLFLTRHELFQNSSFLRGYKLTNIETIEIRFRTFGNLEEPQQNRVLKLISKILLFKYSKKNFFAQRRAVTLTLSHNTQLITLFLTRYKLFRNFSFPWGYKPMNIEIIDSL